MRKRYRVLVIAALLAALAVPVGFALSLEAPTPVRSSHDVRQTVHLPQVPGPLQLFTAGTFLIVLAALVRKSV